MAHNVLRMAEVAARRETGRGFSQSVQPLGCGVVGLGLGHSVLCAVPPGAGWACQDGRLGGLSSIIGTGKT